MLKRLYQACSQNKAFLFLVFVGSLTWTLTMVKSGLIYPYGMGFWGANGHDGVWHLSLINQLAEGGFKMPVFAGETIKNYHFGFDLVVALIYRLSGISPRVLYFQLLPALLAILIGGFVYQFVLQWRKSKEEAFYSTFFVYFGAGFGFLVTFFREGRFSGESLFWAQQAVSTLINPPLALSFLVLIIGLRFLLKYQRKSKTKHFFLAILAFGVLIQIKSYASILVLISLSVTGLYRYWKIKKADFLALAFWTFIVSLILFLPFLKEAAALLEFKPFWFLETMMAYSDRLGWIRFYSAMTTYKLGGIWFKALLAYSFAFLVFWYGNMGTRLISEVTVAKWLMKKRLEEVEVFVICIISLGVLLPLFFVQKGTPWNTIQFFYYSLFFGSLVAGVAMREIVKRSKWGVLVIVVLTLPTSLSTLKNDFLPSRPPAMISTQELEALEFLGQQENGVVLTVPFDRSASEKAKDNPPRPLYLYESTAYVAAISGKQTFLEDEVNLNIMGFAWQKRREEVTDFFKEPTSDFLKGNGIDYLYLVGETRKKQIPRTKTIFENGEVRIDQVI